MAQSISTGRKSVLNEVFNMEWKIWNKGINKKEQIQKWVEWCDIPIIIKKNEWWDDHQWKGNYSPSKQVIEINGSQSDKEIIKSIIHEISHWVNNHQVNDPNIWENEEHCINNEKQWKKEPEEVIW